ncbi:unnamed protein product [Zymoseptoria tritici ST99CH_1A5]|uniref:Uncharacterized protein n=1 Tax=Zymoseptoria tritici ST99CH_1A5 TaxID=1276529 RepID=A0A1Y6LBP3_ZYMTR|nr:unnamed protein product [Zymoseptoria tritici ST99CH_1A5]
MPYTLLQTMNFLSAGGGKWERIYNIKSPPTNKITKKMKFPGGQPQLRTCALRCYRGRVLRSRKKRKQVTVNKTKLMMVFKRSGPGRKKNMEGENPPCGGEYFPEKEKGSRWSLRNVDAEGVCRVCGMFLNMFVQDLEASVPGLRRSLRIREMRRTSKG